MASSREYGATFRSLFDVILHTETVDPASLADGAGETISVTVTGAAVGDIVHVGPGVDLQDMTLTAYVSAADTVEMRLQNESGAGPTDLASSTWNIIVLQPARLWDRT